MSLIESPFLSLQATTYGGRSLFATGPICVGTLIHTSQAPCAHVVYRDHRKVVCAWCFAQSDAGPLKVVLSGGINSAHTSGPGGSGERFCSVICKDLWLAEGTRGDGIRGKIHTAVEAGVRRMNKAKLRSPDSAHPPQESDLTAIPADVRTQGGLDAAWAAAAAKSDAEIAQLNEMELEIMRFVCSGLVQMYLLRNESPAMIINAQQSSLSQASILNLQENELPHTGQRPYILDSHIRIHSFLRCALNLGRRDSAAMFGIGDAVGGQKAGGWIRAILSRDAANAFGIRQASPDTAPEHVAANELDSHEESDMVGWGLWVDASFFNHSCSPNIKKVRIGRTLQFYTTEAVQLGEELCISYVDLEPCDSEEIASAEVNVKQAGDARRKLLSNSWFFACRCPRCQLDQGLRIATSQSTGI
ncbi:SET domain-containing protein [Athelia psychrophila]|uniref:SET domain-containing protein n=1 Tax=Athelia psychrophila TaxID=1759441 RepID=A0A166KJB2_9AGAM|nr:SET domain-containing protein [Fibularhizoctonia sp. CBS 109695]